MRVIIPHNITDAMLLMSSVPEPDTGEPAAYNPATTYSLGQTVFVAATHKIYESLVNSNLNNYPPDEPQGDADNPPTKWLEIKSTNKWDIFDYARNTKTTSNSPYIFTLQAGVRSDSIALLGLEADSAMIEVLVGTEVKYTRTINLSTRVVTNWYEYFFANFGQLPSLVLFDLPVYSQAIIRVTLSGIAPTVKLGACVIGRFEELGDPQYGASLDSINYSKIENTFDGRTQLLKRNNVPETTQDLFSSVSRINKIRDVRDALNATPAVWVGITDPENAYYESFIILGIYTQMSIKAFGANEVQTNLTIREIIK